MKSESKKKTTWNTASNVQAQQKLVTAWMQNRCVSARKKEKPKSTMKKEEALKLVNSYFDKKNKKNDKFVMTYSSKIKKSIVKWFNFMKYRVRLRILRKIEISDYLKPDVQEIEKYMINFRGIYEAKYFWIIHWGMTKFVEELDIRHGLIGTGPIIVNKKTSRLFHTSTSMLDIMDKIKNDIDVDLKLLGNFGSEIK